METLTQKYFLLQEHPIFQRRCVLGGLDGYETFSAHATLRFVYSFLPILPITTTKKAASSPGGSNPAPSSLSTEVSPISFVDLI